MNVRRVITGFRDDGVSTALIDGPAPKFGRGLLVWSTDSIPADNEDNTDGGTREVSLHEPKGSNFYITTLPAGYESRLHKATSMSYGIILSGEFDLIHDDGVPIRLRAGDVYVQRGTVHRVSVPSDGPMTMAQVILPALTVKGAGEDYPTTGLAEISKPGGAVQQAQ